MKRTLAVRLVLAFLAILAAVPVNASNDFGVQIEFYRDAHKQAEMMAAAGVRWVRIDLAWSAAEPEPGRTTSGPGIASSIRSSHLVYKRFLSWTTATGCMTRDCPSTEMRCAPRRGGPAFSRACNVGDLERAEPAAVLGRIARPGCMSHSLERRQPKLPGGSPSVDSGPIHRRRDIRLQLTWTRRSLSGSSTSSTRCRCIRMAPRFLKRPRRSTTKCDAALRAISSLDRDIPVVVSEWGYAVEGRGREEQANYLLRARNEPQVRHPAHDLAQLAGTHDSLAFVRPSRRAGPTETGVSRVDRTSRTR